MQLSNRAFSSLLGRGVFRREPWTARHHPATIAESGAKARTGGKWIKLWVSSHV